MQMKLTREQRAASRYLSSATLADSRLVSSLIFLERAESARNSITAAMDGMGLGGGHEDAMCDALAKMDSAVETWNEAVDAINAHRREGGGCPYCRGERPLLDDMGKDGGWFAGIHPGDGTMAARFNAGPMFGNACGELLLDIEHCPRCGADMAGVAAKLEAELARAREKLRAIEEKVVEIEDAQFGGYAGEGDLVDELDWLSGEIDSLRAHVEGGL